MSWNGAALGEPLVPPPLEPEGRSAVLEGRSSSGGKMAEIDQAQLLASIAATSHDCILSIDPATNILWASPATVDVLGWQPEDLAGSELTVVFPRDDTGLLDAALGRLLADERVEPFVASGVRRNGSTFKTQVTLGPVRDDDGRITGVTVILRDVTAQLDEQRELALALEMSRAHFDQSVTPQAILDLRGRLESVNPAWCELFGRGEGWFADCDILTLVHPDDVDNVVLRLGRLRSGELDSVSYHGLFRDAEGRSLSLLLDAALLREPGGKPYAIAASVGDLHDGEVTQHELDVRRRIADALGQRTWDTAVVVDDQLAITYVSGSVAQLLAYDREDLPHHLSWDYVHPDDAPLVAGLLEQVLAVPRRHERAVVRLRDGQQRWRWVEVTATNCLADPEIRGIVANLRDVTEQVQTEEALRVSEALHRALVETAQEGIMATAPDGKTIFANETAARALGRTVESLYGEDPAELFGVPLSEGQDDTSRHEVAHLRPDGQERILEISYRPLNSRNSRLGSLVTVSDVTDARRLERDLRRRALHDPLTSLPNRYLFLDRLETAAARQRRVDGGGPPVLFLDLDDFKQVNDGFGHHAGDELLREVAVRLQGAVRGTDTVGRLGGDEFAVICEDTDEEAALLVARRILDAFEEPIRVRDHSHPAGVSIGIALAPPYDIDELVRRADEAMYDAKQRGGGRIAVAGQDQDTSPTS